MTIFARRARLDQDWAENVRLTIDNGKIAEIHTDVTAKAGDTRVDTLLPALGNLHSHAFQRAMAGMTEYRAADRDSFWSWRELMYRFLGRLTPEHMEAIAALVFMEMQEAGYAAVGEFHYVHHQMNGAPYDAIAEMSDRIFAAATTTGIGLTHLPVLYSYGGAGKKPLAGGQNRFANTVERFAELVGTARKNATDMPADTVVGIAPHSLRATAPDELAAVLPLREDNPCHIHVAEQPREVAEISDWLGAPPVEWLLDNMPVDESWCFIHATHMTGEETRRMAEAGIVAGLCPITEANLGDGPFNGPQFLRAGGTFGIGSDSNVRIALGEELRTLEYSQRLRDLARNVMVNKAGSVGEALYLGAAKGGGRALRREAGRITEGCLADLVAIDSAHPTLYGLRSAQLIDGLVFAAGGEVVTDLWSAGRHAVRGGVHQKRDVITAEYRKAMDSLLGAA